VLLFDFRRAATISESVFDLLKFFDERSHSLLLV
jgi:hypothetical protein